MKGVNDQMDVRKLPSPLEVHSKDHLRCDPGVSLEWTKNRQIRRSVREGKMKATFYFQKEGVWKKSRFLCSWNFRPPVTEVPLL